jgi:hypothetical protein
MNYDLFNAILSMDSYNRGYDAGIEFTAASIGSATVGNDSEELGDINVNGSDVRRDQEIGFYAVAYDIQGGETIISFRGTDENGSNPIYAEDCSGVDPSVWLWARGAFDVNDASYTPYFSDYIRDYTTQQQCQEAV